MYWDLVLEYPLTPSGSSAPFRRSVSSWYVVKCISDQGAVAPLAASIEFPLWLMFADSVATCVIRLDIGMFIGFVRFGCPGSSLSWQ